MGSLTMPTELDDRYIGLGLAISGSLAIGTSFIITKKGLIDAAEQSAGFSSESYSYLQNPIWWAGMVTMVVGELANFAAYTFAPPILVTPLGAMSVLVGAILASIFLKEELGRIGRVGCALCLAGSLVIVMHAPEDKDVSTVDEILDYATQPGFLFYCFFCAVFCLFMIYRVAPIHGQRNPLVYISICSLAGSVSIMAIKGFGVALKLTFAGNNQLTHLSTYVFGFVTVGCIAVQMNYFNKALDQFSTNVVNPIYYVCFTTATIIASMIMFQGLNTAGPVNDVSLITGFVVIFLGVYLLNISRTDPSGSSSGHHPSHSRLSSHLENGILHPRMSMTMSRGSNDIGIGRRSSAHDGHVTRSHTRHGSGGYGHSAPPSAGYSARRASGYDKSNDSTLFDAYPEESVGLTQLGEISDEEEASDPRRPLSGHGGPPARSSPIGQRSGSGGEAHHGPRLNGAGAGRR